MKTSIVRKISGSLKIPQKHLEVPKRNEISQLRERKVSWTLIDGEIDEIHWSSTDGCRKWAKRFLTIGNIIAICVSICILMSASYFCLAR